MNNKKLFLAIIPARKGSKGIKNKNKIIFFKKPLICWTIEEALKSKLLNKIIVSTDDEEILNFQNKYKDKRVFFEKRPSFLADDNSKIYDTIKYHIDKNKDYENLILLQPDSPLRKVKHINDSIKKFISKKADSCVSVTRTKKPPELFYQLNKNFFIKKDFLIDKIAKNKQDFDSFHEINGSIYISKIKNFIKNKSFLSDKTLGFEMSREYSTDIDNDFDLEVAKFFFKKNLKN